MMAVSNLDDFQALDPFFRIIEEGVAGLVDGAHFFDLLAEDVVFEYIITVPGYPHRVAGRQAVAELYRSYGATIVLDRCYDLAVHHDQVAGVVVLEYASRSSGTFPNTGPGGPLSPFIRKATSESDNRGRTMRLVSVRRHRVLLPTGRSRVAEFPL